MTCINDGNRKIIAISGKQLSGKDFITKLLLEKLPGFKRVGLGDAIKLELARQKNISIEYMEQNKHIYRPELIALGNYGRTLEDGMYWINKVLAISDNIIVPDIRVEKEFLAFKEAGAIMFRVEADRDIRASRGSLVNENDPTECALDYIDEWDVVIYNNSNADLLKLELDKILKLMSLYTYSDF